MRLFRRRDNDADAPGPEGPASGAPEGDVARQPKQPTGDWMTMAPLAPSFPAMPTTFRVQTLPEILTSHKDTRLSGSLGHAVSADAPSGSISGLTSRSGDGLAHSGDVSPQSGMGELLLREPHHAPAEPEPAIEVRRLADPAPISTSTPAMAAPSLPEPTVSRSLLDTAPLAARPATERPLPVARVVDAAATASAPAAAPALAPQSLSSEPEPADLVPSDVDDRVGGFGVDSDEPYDDGTMAVADDVPRSAPPADLMPPIQPRRIQRRVDPAAPLLGDARPTTSVDPVVPDGAAPKAAGGGALPLVNPTPTPSADVTVSRLAQGGSPPSTSGSTPASNSAASSGASGSGTSRSDSSSLDASSRSVDAAPGSPGSTAPKGGSGPRDAGADAFDGSADVAVSRRAEDGGAPLSGSQPLTATGAPLGDQDGPTSSGGGDLPLHAPAAASIEPPIQRLADVGHSAPPSTMTNATSADDDAPTSSSTSSSDDGPATPHDDVAAPTIGSAPTLGADQPMVHVQPMAEGAGTLTPSSSPGTGGLPLAPSDLGGALQPPPPRDTADVQRSPDASSATRPLVSPAATHSAASTTSTPSLQRLASSSPGSAPASAPTSGALPFVRPLQRTAGTAGASPMSTLTPPTNTAGPSSDLPVQLRRLGAPDVGAGVATAASLSTPTGTSQSGGPLPLAAVQRLDAGSTATTTHGPSSASTGNGQPATSDLPLHTPAASVPTAADVAVRAGLAERGPDGDLLYTSAAAASSFALQRQADESLNWGSGGGDGGGQELSVQRAAPEGSEGTPPPIAASNPYSNGRPAARPAQAAPQQEAPTGQDANADNKSLAAEAKKLYPFIRSALEADIRRQIEGKSRASRFRP